MTREQALGMAVGVYVRRSSWPEGVRAVKTDAGWHLLTGLQREVEARVNGQTTRGLRLRLAPASAENDWTMG